MAGANDFASFHHAAREIADGQYFTTRVIVTEASKDCGNAITIRWQAYLSEHEPGWTAEHETAEACLAELRAMPRTPPRERKPVDETPLEQIGEVVL